MSDSDRIEIMLTATDEETRLQGLRELTQVGARQYMASIYRALGDESWRVRKEAVAVFLGITGVGSLAGEVVDLLHTEDNAGLRNAAVEILVGLGRQASAALVEELSCSDHDVRKFVLDILGEIGDDSCVPAMIGALADPDNNVRAAAAENLGKLRAAEATPALLDALAIPDLLLRFATLEALGQIEVPLPVERLLPLAEERLLRKALFDCLGRLGDADAIPTLVNGLGDTMRNVRSAAAQALHAVANRHAEEVAAALSRQAGSPLLDKLAELLESHDIAVCRAAIGLLGWSKDVRYLSRMLQLFDDEVLRDAAAAALIGYGDAATEVLLSLWREGDDRRKSYLAYVFAALDCRDALPLLHEALTTANPELQVMLLHALGRLGGEGELHHMAVLLTAESDEVRGGATDALTQIGTRNPRAAVAVLTPLFSSEDAELRMRIVQILGRLAEGEVESLMLMALKDESAPVRRSAVQAVGRNWSERRLQSLLLVLTDEDQEVRRLAVEALGTSTDSQVLRPLTLALQDEDIWVRAAAVRALGHLPQAEALLAVEGALGDSVGLVVIATLETLVAMDQSRAQVALVAALDNSDEEVVSAALQLLAQYGDSVWIEQQVERLLNHRHWEVRVTFARILAAEFGLKSIPPLEARLLVEGEDLVRQQIKDLLLDLQG